MREVKLVLINKMRAIMGRAKEYKDYKFDLKYFNGTIYTSKIKATSISQAYEKFKKETCRLPDDKGQIDIHLDNRKITSFPYDRSYM